MPITNVARDLLSKAIVGQAFTAWTNASAKVGVGNGTTAFAASQTDLQGASMVKNAVDATFPQITGNVMTYRATFGIADGNFAWEEWCVINTVASMLNRKVESLGTKPGTQTWQLQVTLTMVAS